VPRRFAKAHLAELPSFVPPELATLANKPPAGDAWAHEIKLDGSRTAARIACGQAHLLTPHWSRLDARFRPIAATLAVPKIRAAYLDGEIAVLARTG
jgi:bifunctional non-homologous end joining protein LigD